MKLNCINIILSFSHGNQDRVWFKNNVFKITMHYRFKTIVSHIVMMLFFFFMLRHFQWGGGVHIVCPSRLSIRPVLDTNGFCVISFEKIGVLD